MDEEQGLASPIAGGLRGIRRSVSSSVFTGRSAAPQNEGDSISTNLISQNSLTLNSVSLQLSGIKEQVRSVNSSLESIKNNLELSESLEKKKQAEKERREALLAEQGLREGAEGSLEKKIQFALLTPVRRVANFTKGILSRITDSLLFLAGGWLVDQTLTFFRLTSEENVEGLKKFKEQLVGNLLIIGGLVLATTVGLGKVLGLTKILGATFLRAGVFGILTRPFQALFTFIARNVLKFKNLLLGGIIGLAAMNVYNDANSPNAKAIREQSVTNNALMATGASIPFLGALANLRRRTLNIGRKLLGKPIVPQEALNFKPDVKVPPGDLGIVGKAKLNIARGTQRALNFGGKLLGVFNKLYYVAEGVFDFADYKKRGNSNFQAFIGSATRGVTKYLTFGAGMKGGAVLGGLIGGPPGALIGAILGGIGVSIFNLDKGPANITGGLADKMTGAIPEGKKMLEDGSIVDDTDGTAGSGTAGSGNVEGTNTTESVSAVDIIDGIAVTGDSSESIVPFKRDNNFKNLELDENVEVVTVPLDITPNSGAIPDTSSSSVSANKVPTFSSSDYANNFPTIAESMFNVSTV